MTDQSTRVARVFVDAEELCPLVSAEWESDEASFESFRLGMIARLKMIRDVLTDVVDRLESEQEWEEGIHAFDA